MQYSEAQYLDFKQNEICNTKIGKEVKHMGNNSYKDLMQYQERKFEDIDMKKVIDSIVEAKNMDGVDGQEVSFRNTEDSLSRAFLKISYFSEDEQGFNADIINILTASGTYDIPLYTQSGTINYQEIENQIRKSVSKFSKFETYIDTNFGSEITYESSINEQETVYADEERFDEQALNEQVDRIINTQTGSRVTEPDIEPEEAADAEPEFRPEKLNKKRTHIESSQDVNLNNIAKELRALGYDVRTKRGGSLCVTSENLPEENSITISRKNAYIETAELKSQAEVDIYNKMRENVEKTMHYDLEQSARRQEMVLSAPSFAEVPLSMVAQEMLTTFNTDKMEKNPDFSDVFSEPKLKYSFKDAYGRDYLSISMGYSVKDDDSKEVFPVIYAQYGKEYGDISKQFAISEGDLNAAKNSQLYNSTFYNKFKEFTEIGMLSRESVYKEVLFQKTDRELDKLFKSEFKNLKSEKAEFFSGIAKEYFRLEEKKATLSEYMIDNMHRAPFFKDRMLSDAGKERFSQMFDAIEQKITKKIEEVDLSNVKFNEISPNKMKLEIEKNGELVEGGKEKTLFECDRKWLQDLGRIEDKLIDLRNGPVQDMIDTAKSIAKGINEARKGIITFYKDGIYSGFELGSGIGSFKDGLTYGHVLHQMEAQYKALSQSGKEEDQIAAIGKGIDIRLYRDDINRNANIYVKAAVAIRNRLDNMIDAISAFRRDADASLRQTGRSSVTVSAISALEKNFKALGNEVVLSFKEASHSLSEIGKGLQAIGSNTIGFTKDTVNVIQAKSAVMTNNFKEQYNNMVLDAKVALSMNEYAKNRIAEKLNDARIEQAFNGIDSNDFHKIAQTKFWKELDHVIALGEEAERNGIDPDAGKMAMDGKMAKIQKEQNLYIADALNKQIKNTILRNDKMTMSKAIDLMAEEYHKTAMAYNLLNGAASAKGYASLSEQEKEMCKEVIKEVLMEMPNVVEKLEHNEKVEEKGNVELESDGHDGQGEKDSIPASDYDR